MFGDLLDPHPLSLIEAFSFETADKTQADAAVANDNGTKIGMLKRFFPE